ncbi:MAG: hypothetical protein MAG795_00071 [Candidatus Woesearchaeota archaeon]|nr:hypothetical protein [Candidatus Woesearchaeota archaeon]
MNKQARINWLQNLLIIVVFVSLIHVAAALDPYFDPEPPKTFNLTEDVNFYYDLNATDDDNDLPLIYSHDALSWGFESFYMDNLTGIINFTPPNDDVGLNTFTLIVTDALEDQDSKFVYFNVSNVNDPPNITAYSPVNLDLGVYENDSPGYWFDYNVTDPDTLWGDVLNNTWIKNGENFTNNHSWLWEPGFCEPVGFNITLKVWDSSGETQTVNWTVSITNVNRPPTYNWSNPISNLTWPEDNDLLNNFSLDTHFYDADYIECNDSTDVNYTVVGNQNITINISNSTPYWVSFFPDTNWYGLELATFSLSDGEASASSNLIYLNVTNVGDQPIVDFIGNQTAFGYVPFILQVNATDNDQDTMWYFDNTTLFEINRSTGLVNFTPEYSDLGNYSIQINVTDGLYNTSMNFSLNIMNNTPPNIDPISDLWVEEGALFTLAVNATDIDGDNITFLTNFTKMAEPYWTDNTSQGRFQMRPNQSDVGNHTIIATAKDHWGAVNSTVFNLEVVDVNLAPIMDNITSPVVVKINKSFYMELNATDPDFNDLNFTHNVSLLDFPNFNMTIDGIMNFTANQSDEGNRSINFTVWDITPAPKSDSKIVEFVVTWNRPPIIYPIPLLNATEDILFSYTINATDPDYDSVNMSVNTTWFNISEGGLFEFTPNQSMLGYHNFSLNATDNDGGWTYTTFVINITGVNDAPYFDPALINYSIWDNIYEDQLAEIIINVTDEEGDNLTFSRLFTTGSNLFNIYNYTYNFTKSQALINFTPGQTDIGNYTVNITVSDQDKSTTETINFTVLPINDAPQIVTFYPYGTPVSNITVFAWHNYTSFPNTTNINATENSTVLFNHTSTDEDNASLLYFWYLDENIVSTQSYWSYAINFSADGNHNITLRVSDGILNSSMNWNLTVSNFNRRPSFGTIIDSTDSDFNQGVATNLDIFNDSIKLNFTNEYKIQGTYTSSVMNLDRDFGFNYSTISWNVVKNQTNEIYLRERTSSDSSDWGNWSDWTALGNNTEDTINAPNLRYIQYALNFSTNNTNTTPILRSVSVNYVIENKTWYESQDIGEGIWIDLDHFFNDPDGDPLNYSVIGESIVDVRIQNSTNYVGLYPQDSGLDYIQFIAEDHNGSNIASNTVTLTVLESQSPQVVVQSSGGGSSVVTKPIPEEVQVKFNLNMIVPEAVTIYKNGTVVTPIRLINNEDEALNDINLSAEVNNTDIEFEFTKDTFETIGPGEEAKTNLVMTAPDIIGSYEIVVHADVASPEYSDSAKIHLATIEKGQVNETQLNTRISFTRDFLLSNPECLELNELLNEAKAAINSSRLDEATQIIDETVRYCRYLIASKETMTQKPDVFHRFFYRIFGTTSNRRIILYSIAIVSVFTLLVLSLLLERHRVKRRLKKFQKKKEKLREKSLEEEKELEEHRY